ncbi:IS5 family transposase [Amphritea sp.]|uniref:IS5 family transposase n=1 Tax=Amphritea sp. TaxID=1872502 RepID=UPI0025B859FA|nr:IS5 family transposase [Amphritea sp.]
MELQLGFSDFEKRKSNHQTRKEKFLARMEVLVPWTILEVLIEPYYPKRGNGRPPYPLSSMLRIHCLQQWYSLSDLAAEDALYETTPMRRFSQLSLDHAIPDHTTIMNFRHLLERYELGRQIFEAVNGWLEEAGILLKEGSEIDATIIDAPCSIKNKLGTRDPEMHQTKKGNQWYFGLKAYIGIDVNSGLTHSFTTTSANQHDLNEAHQVLHGEEKYVFADSGYRGAEKREELADKELDWFIAEQPSKVKQLKEHPRKNKKPIKLEYLKASVRAFVEHPFRIIKCQFGFKKARYKGLEKNDNKLAVLFALSNIVKMSQLIKT